MGELWRSDEMSLVQIFVQYDQARDTLDELGKLGLLQFKDMNPEVTAFQRNFVNEVKRTDELQRQLRYFESQVEKAGLIPRPAPSALLWSDRKPPKLDDLEHSFEERERELQQLNVNSEAMERNFNEAVESQFVLQHGGHFFDDAAPASIYSDINEVNDFEDQPLINRKENVQLGYHAGILARDKMMNFERVIWRTARGNMYLRQVDIPEKIKDPSSGQLQEKTVFVVFFQGQRLNAKIKKICESFGANLYACPEATSERAAQFAQVQQKISEMRDVLQHTVNHLDRVLQDLSFHLETWKSLVLREKAIFHTMNLFDYDTGRQCLIGEAWCPTASLDDVQLSLRRATEKNGGLVPSVLTVMETHDTPPTYFRTNKFTEAFQAIIDSYGVPRYREINPATLTIITFPFLFGVMYGDVGHGIIMFLGALYFVAKEEELGKGKLNEIMVFLFDGRYVLLLMGLFSIYCGFMYNEFFSVPMKLFGSGFIFYGNQTQSHWDKETSEVYPFGVDPAWKGSENELLYYNSLKMKLSVILGICQMVVGIFISLLNAIHFGHNLDIIFGFVPQIVFLIGLFGYMDFLVFAKWLNPRMMDIPNPPSLINTMINIFLKPFDIADGDQIYGATPELQLHVQQGLALISIAVLPLLLFGKPCTLNIRKKMGQEVIDEHTGEPFVMGEAMVTQLIHAIEFILGCLSNTASYLRLWALSLAHSELATVFWKMVLVQIGLDKPVIVFFCWAIWAALTIGILVVMEALSAFLHALRLHWVEFQNKFFGGDGYAFTPFAYSRLEAFEGAKG